MNNRERSNILIVDDNPIGLYTKRRLLSQHGYDIHGASTGHEALSMVKTRLPDLVLLDVNLPDMSGFEVCHQLKTHPDTQFLKVVQTSAVRIGGLDRVKGLEMGADAYLVEPAVEEEVLGIIRALLRLAGQERSNRQLIQKLSQTERRLMEATEAANCGMWDWDIPRGTLEWFGVHEQLAGLLPDSFSGKIEAFTDALHPDDRPRVWQRLQALIARGETLYADEYRFIHPDGTVHWMSGTGRLYYDEQGHAVRMTGVVQDITKRKQAEEALQHRNRQLELLALASQRLLLGNESDQELLVPIFEDLARLIDMEMFYHYRPSDEPERLRLHAAGGITEKERSRFATMEFGQLLCGRVAEWRERIIVEDLQHSSHPGSDVLREAGATSYAGFPLLANGELVGTIAFISNRRTVLGEGDVQLIQAICDQIAIAFERDRLHRDLQAGEERLRLALEGADLGSWDLDLRTGVAVWNRRHAEVQGYDGLMTGSLDRWRDRVHPDDLDTVLQAIERAKAERTLFSVEHRIARADNGEERWLALYGKCSYDEQGEPVRFSGVSRDITERKQAEAALRETQEYLSHELEAMRSLQAVSTALLDSDEGSAIYERILDAAVSIMRSQYASIQLWDQSKDELKLIGYRGISPGAAAFWEWVHPASSSTCGVALRMRERVIVTDVIQCEWMAGTEDLATYLGTGILAVQTTPLVTRDGCLLGMLSTHWEKTHRPSPEELQRLDILARMAVDIMARQQNDAALRESEERLRLAMSIGRIGHWEWQADSNRIRWSDELVALNGFGPDEFGGTFEGLLSYVHPEDRERFTDCVQRSATTGDDYELEFRFQRPDGVVRWTLAKGRSERGSDGRLIRMSGIDLDITERKRTEEALQEVKTRLQAWNVELEQAVTAKTAELVQSQERLRALASELNLAEQRERKRLAAELHDHLQQMLVFGKITIGQGKRHVANIPIAAKALENVDRMLSDALTYSRTLVAELSPPGLREHGLSAALNWLAQYMEQKYGQRVTVIMPEGEGLTLPEDQRILLFQSVRELLINVAKHAGTGAATVKMTETEDEVQIQVCDDGRGFDLAAAAAAAAGGLPSGGISSKFGLFSIEERMRAMGGTFDIQSAPGQGTVATLSLPLRDDARGKGLGVKGQETLGSDFERRSLFTPHASRVRVLLVDDHIMVRQGLRAVLDAYADIELVGEAGDGEEAVRLVNELHPAVVVMDISMPKMNGIDATMQIKTRHPETLIIGLSVNAAGENQEAMERAGAVRLMTKEAAVEQLYDVLQEAVRQTRM